jgi:hypothetical protein
LSAWIKSLIDLNKWQGQQLKENSFCGTVANKLKVEASSLGRESVIDVNGKWVGKGQE